MDNEYKLIRIVEERGVAVSPWKREIDAIVSYIRTNVRSLLQNKPIGTELRFSIPKEYLSSFNFLKNPQINIIANLNDNNDNNGYGSYRNGKVSFFNKRLKNAVITIYCFYNSDGKVWLNTILKTLYHEFNHAYDAWIDGNKDKTFRRFYKSAMKGLLGNDIEEKTPYKYIGICIYRLFSETEYNALVASVFGDLQSIDSDFTTFRNDYKRTTAYAIYNDLNDNLQKEIDSLSKDDCINIINLLKKYSILLNMRNNTVSSFKNAFMHKANIKLNNLLKDIGRVASLYYDKKQEEEINNVKNREIR